MCSGNFTFLTLCQWWVSQDKPIKKMMKKLLALGFVDPDEWHHVQMKWAREAGKIGATISTYQV